MLQRQYLKKTKKYQQIQSCMICKIPRVTLILSISQNILHQKYYYPIQKSNHSGHIHHILSMRGSNPIKNIYRQTQIFISCREQLLQYNNFTAVVSKIKNVVLERTKRDQNIPPHFFGQANKIMWKRIFSKRRVGNGRVNIKIEKQSINSTDEELKLDKRKFLPKNQRIQESQTVSMRRLTRNLSNMVRKFEENLEFHPSLIFEIIDFVPGHAVDLTKFQGQQHFKRQLEDNSISEIKERKQIQYLHTNPENGCKKFQENYGFRPRVKLLEAKCFNADLKHKESSKSGNKFPLRVQTDYDCQQIKKKKASQKKLIQRTKGTLGANSRKKQSKENKLSNATSASKSRLKQKV